MSLQQLSKNSELKKHEKIIICGKSHHHIIVEKFNSLCDLKEQETLGGSQEMAEQLQQNHGNRVHNELLVQASCQSV